MSEIIFTIPESTPGLEISKYLQDNVDCYLLALDRTGDFYDRKSQVDQIEVTQVEVTQDRVTIHYTVEYSGFRPCQDLRYAEVAQRKIHGRRNGYEFRFDVFQAQERRSTCDEL